MIKETIVDITKTFIDIYKLINRVKSDKTDLIIFRESSILVFNNIGVVNIINIFKPIEISGCIRFESLSIIYETYKEFNTPIIYSYDDNILEINGIGIKFINPNIITNQEKYLMNIINNKSTLIYNNSNIREIPQFEYVINMPSSSSISPVLFDNNLIYLHPSMIKVLKSDKVSLKIYKYKSFKLYEFYILNKNYSITVYINTIDPDSMQ